MLNLTELIGFGAGNISIPFSHVLTADVTDSSDVATSHSFNDLAIGAAQADRIIVAAVSVKNESGSGSALLSSVTADGSAMTKAIQRGSNGTESAEVIVALYYKNIPAGVTADFVLNYPLGSPAATAATITLYALYGCTVVAPYDTAADYVDPLNLNVDVLNPSIGIGVAAVEDNSTFSWTGATQDAGGFAEGRYTVSSAVFSATETNKTITADVSNEFALQAGVFAVWR